MFHVNEEKFVFEDKVKNPQEPNEPPAEPVSFRISCKCTGALSRHFSLQVDDATCGHKIF